MKLKGTTTAPNACNKFCGKGRRRSASASIYPRNIPNTIPLRCWGLFHPLLYFPYLGRIWVLCLMPFELTFAENKNGEQTYGEWLSKICLLNPCKCVVCSVRILSFSCDENWFPFSPPATCVSLCGRIGWAAWRESKTKKKKTARLQDEIFMRKYLWTRRRHAPIQILFLRTPCPPSQCNGICYHDYSVLQSIHIEWVENFAPANIKYWHLIFTLLLFLARTRISTKVHADSHSFTHGNAKCQTQHVHTWCDLNSKLARRWAHWRITYRAALGVAGARLREREKERGRAKRKKEREKTIS